MTCVCGGTMVYQKDWIGPGPNAKCDTCGRTGVMTTSFFSDPQDWHRLPVEPLEPDKFKIEGAE